MKFLSLGKIDKNIIPITVGCIFCFLSRLLFRFTEDSALFEHSILSNIIISISYIFTIIPFLILKYRTYNKQKKENIQNNDLEDSEDNSTVEQKDITKGKWLYIFLYNFIELVQSIILIYSIELKSNYWILDIFITCIFYYFIFKIKLYKHHYFSMIIIIIIGIILDLVRENLQYDIKNNLIFILLRLLRETLVSLNDVHAKYLFDKKFCLIYEISLSNGIMNTFLYIILAIFDHYFIQFDDFSKYFDEFNIKELSVIIGLMVTQLGLYLCILIVNKANTPCHIFIIFVFGQLAYYIDFSKISILFMVCLLLILFMSLIFNEIIEINCFGFEKNTKKNIEKRARMESNDLLVLDIQLIKDKEEVDLEENDLDSTELIEIKKPE